MNPKSVFRVMVERAILTTLRHGVSALGLWLAAKGFGVLSDSTQTNLVECVGGLVVALGAGVWSYYTAKFKDKKIAWLEWISGQPPATKEFVKPNDPTMPPISLLLLSTFFVASMTSCVSMSNFDQNTYASAMELKTISLDLIKNATRPGSEFKDKIDSLKARLSAQLAYEKGKGKSNQISATQWEVLVNPERDLLGKLLTDWGNGTAFTTPYLEEKSLQISEAFDQILNLEGAKTK